MLPIQLSIDIYSPKELNTHIHTKTYKCFFMIAKTWKQPSSPSAGTWVNGLSIQTVEYYVAVKKKSAIRPAKI